MKLIKEGWENEWEKGLLNLMKMAIESPEKLSD